MPKRRHAVWNDDEEEDEEYKAASAGSGESDAESEISFEKEIEKEEKKAELEKKKREKEEKRQRELKEQEEEKLEAELPARRTRQRKQINYNEDALMRDLDEEIDEEEGDVDGGVRKRQKLDGEAGEEGRLDVESGKSGNSKEDGESDKVKNSSDSEFVPEHEEPGDADFVVSDDAVDGDEDEDEMMGRHRARKSRKPQFVVKDDEESEEDAEFDPDSSLAAGRGRHSRHGGVRRRGRPRIHGDDDDEDDEDGDGEGDDEDDGTRTEKDEPKTLEDELRSLKQENEENGLPNGDGDGEEDQQDNQEDETPGTPVHRHLRRRKQVNYTLPPPVLTDAQIEQLNVAANVASAHESPRRRAGRYGGGSMYGGSFHSAESVRRLFPTAGPFGGSEVRALYGKAGEKAGVSRAGEPCSDSDSASDADGGTGNATRLPARRHFHDPAALQASSSSSSSDSEVEALVAEADRRVGPAAGAAAKTTVQEGSAAPRKGRKNTLADTDPLGGDASIDFSSVGGLDRYISQLKEMITLPLLYPELYTRFHISPPRGVLFHGPPGTGKTLMARALASSCTAEGRKITFFMRKGSDCLSKWVGEAERNLRLLFQEAEKKQPSIIFFDEIDGLAPVRSSKQEQIHASIVSTLLALMDGIDNRGQVVVIGATNRPDAVDPALRRPGRFDREFYFPLPDLQSRAQIIRIHTKLWANRPSPAFVAMLAHMTKGYGGADLKALCAESALNAIQRTFPQIYSSARRLQIDASIVHVTPADFARALRRIVPSSARPSGGSATGSIVGTGGGEAGTVGATQSGESAESATISQSASRLEALGKPPTAVLLGDEIDRLQRLVERLIPRTKQLSALEESHYVDFSAGKPDGGFEMQQVVRQLEQSRVFRPRIVVCGLPGQGQQFVCENVLSSLEGLVVQKLDFARLYSDASIVPETAAVHVFQELKMHAPAVLFIPDLLGFLDGCAPSVRSTIASLVRELPARSKVLILGIIEDQSQYAASKSIYDELLTSVFGLECDSSAVMSGEVVQMADPGVQARQQFFSRVWDALKLSPVDYNDIAIRPRRVLPELKVAAEQEGVDKSSQAITERKEAKRKAHRKKMRARNDLRLKNTLKVRLSRLMDTFKTRYKRFRRPVIDDAYLVHLFEEAPDPNAPYQKSEDMILEVSTGKKFHNMDLEVIEERLWNGYYSEPKQFLKDLDLIVRDAKELGERDRIWKANEMYANAEVGVEDMEMAQPKLAKEWKELRRREKRQHKRQLMLDAEQANSSGAANGIVTSLVSSSGLQQQAQAQLTVDLAGKKPAELEDVEMKEDEADMTREEPKEVENGKPANLETADVGAHANAELSVKKLGASNHANASMDLSSTHIESSFKESSKEGSKEDSKENSNQDFNQSSNQSLLVQLPPTEIATVPDKVTLDTEKIQILQQKLVEKTQGVRTDILEKLYSRLIQIVWDNRLEADKTGAISAMDALIGSL